jgi:hypothetical protein
MMYLFRELFASNIPTGPDILGGKPWIAVPSKVNVSIESSWDYYRDYNGGSLSVEIAKGRTHGYLVVGNKLHV